MEDSKRQKLMRLNMYMYSAIKYQESIIVYNFVIGDTSIRTGHLLSKNLLTLEIIKRKMRNFLGLPIEEDLMRPRRSHSINDPVFDGEGERNILNSYLKYRELMKEHPESAFILNDCIAPCKEAFKRDPYDIVLITDLKPAKPHTYILETLSENLLLEFFDCIQSERPPSKDLPYEMIGQLSFTRTRLRPHNKYDTLI